MAASEETGQVGDRKGPAAKGRAIPVLAFAALLVCAIIVLRLLDPAHVRPAIIGLLAILAVAGVFFLFASLAGILRFSSGEERQTAVFAIGDELDEACVVVENDRVVYANRAYHAFFHDGVPQTVERLLAGIPEISEAIYRLAQAARARRPAAEEMRLMPALSGQRDFAWYRLQVKPVGQEATLWIVADVTRDRQSQENVFQELQHAIDYLDHAPAGFFSAESSGAIVYMNATLAGWLGYDLAKVGSGGLDLHDIVFENVAVLMTAVSGAPGEERTETLDTDLRQRDGATFSVRLHHRIAFGLDGKPGASRTLVVPRSLETVPPTRQGSGADFSRFFNTMPVAVATVARQGELVWANAAFDRLFGTHEGRTIQERIAPEQRAEVGDAIAAAAAGRTGIAPLELGVAGEGSRSARVWVRPLAAGAGGEAVILCAIDTTEFRAVEEQLVQAQKLNAIGQLAGGMAHDFNNVLQAIFGYCDILLGNHRPTDPAFQDILQIKQNANRAASLVRQLLAFSRRQTLREETLDLSDRLAETGATLMRLLGERIEFDFRHGRDLWPVKADFHQLEQVMINLAINARDAMPNGGRLTIRTENVPAEQAATLHVPGMPAGDYVLIETADTGTGMTPEVMSKIFEPFFTTKEMGKGTGLGLSSAFGTIKQFGGFIDVRSTLGEGTTFSIYLPRYVAREGEQETEPKTAAAAMMAPPPDMTGQGVILLVEDEDPVRAVNARALTARGYTVLEAASGVEALQIVTERGQPVDLVISDVMMPDMNGPVLLGELRKLYADLKVIFVSGYAEEAFRKDLPQGESFTFLPKPFGLKQLVETVKQVMRS